MTRNGCLPVETWYWGVASLFAFRPSSTPPPSNRALVSNMCSHHKSRREGVLSSQAAAGRYGHTRAALLSMPQPSGGIGNSEVLCQRWSNTEITFDNDALMKGERGRTAYATRARLHTRRHHGEDRRGNASAACPNAHLTTEAFAWRKWMAG